MMDTNREIIDVDVLFVGGGPAGLAGAIKLADLCKKANTELEIVVIEKGARIGNHSLSGAVLNPIALKELIPDFLDQGCPISGKSRGDGFYFLTRKRAVKIPFIPKYMRSREYPLISLSKFTNWLSEIAENLGVVILPESCGKEVLFNEKIQSVIGVRLDDKGLDKTGRPKSNFVAGPEIHAKVSVFAEGARGSLFKQIDQKLKLSNSNTPQIYEIGIKELIQLPASGFFKTRKENVIHTFGYPLGRNATGGGFIYEFENDTIGIGYLVALNYSDPMLDPYNKFLEFKHHPFISQIIKDGEVIEQGARTVSNGGFYTIPELVIDGGVFIGASAAIQNPHELKGIHSSMKTGMLAAEAIWQAFENNDFSKKGLESYQRLFDRSWVKSCMFTGRNLSQALEKKGLSKFFYLGAQYVTNGRGLVDPMLTRPDHEMLNERGRQNLPEKKTPDCDGKLYLDKLTGVYLAKTKHREDQPSHLIIHNSDVCVSICYPKYNCPCTRFCPAKVYELEMNALSGKPKLILNPTNCLHCKTCDIKDPLNNITWTCPEGGSGPAYTAL